MLYSHLLITAKAALYDLFVMLIIGLKRIHGSNTLLSRYIFTHINVGHNVIGWRRGVVASVVRRMNEVTIRRARFVLEWVIIFGRVYRHYM